LILKRTAITLAVLFAQQLITVCKHVESDVLTVLRKK
jgi:hypothetical protein